MAGRLELDSGTRAADGRDVAYLAVAGEVDLANAEQFGEALHESGDGRTGVMIDLRGVSFMDSSGLAVLFRAAHDLGPRLMVVAAPGSAVERLLELTETRELVNQVGSEQEALAALARTDGG
jgi:anti-sigma B factor antagonist